MSESASETPRGPSRSRSLWLRGAIASAVVIASVASLYWFRWRQDPDRVDTSRPTVTPPDDRVSLPSAMPRGRAAVLQLVAAGAEVAESAAPVLRISDRGRIEVVRGISVEQMGRVGPGEPAGPVGPAGPTSSAEVVFELAAVELPGADLQALSPAARAALLEVWSVLGGQARISPEVIGIGLADPEEIERLRRWLR